MAATALTPNIVRLTLRGDELAGFHTYQADDHVKIVFPDADGTQRDPVMNDQQMLDWPSPTPTTRKYTIRRYDPQTLELDLDFVLHDGGVASSWAVSAAVGELVTVAGPPGAKVFPLTYDHYVFAVDATALPAAARWLDESPPDVRARVFVELEHEADQGYPMPVRDGVDVRWLVRPASGSLLAQSVADAPLLSGGGFLFAAGEADDIKPLRAWSRDRMDALITGYWKRGVAGLED